ncbi:hypothetical protein MYSTI_06752 [Myxococcus stipitatus DSM 14675]|uniref:Uncharacterized protein n=1 Tax=Myxococcus stipitatus (strain DSM 14675 / JCM 12634 / Mx s8) TaxID=1278073 RepID=L7UJF7_MYXSD|nr:hypothetical protein [Myxococcus stipitatus]AGC48025.1 hypothetical protein MYSTI_06752 [Myxococcus stipitatus DSM 14675]
MTSDSAEAEVLEGLRALWGPSRHDGKTYKILAVRDLSRATWLYLDGIEHGTYLGHIPEECLASKAEDCAPGTRFELLGLLPKTHRSGVSVYPFDVTTPLGPAIKTELLARRIYVDDLSKDSAVLNKRNVIGHCVSARRCDLGSVGELLDILQAAGSRGARFFYSLLGGDMSGWDIGIVTLLDAQATYATYPINARFKDFNEDGRIRALLMEFGAIECRYGEQDPAEIDLLLGLRAIPPPQGADARYKVLSVRDVSRADYRYRNAEDTVLEQHAKPTPAPIDPGTLMELLGNIPVGLHGGNRNQVRYWTKGALAPFIEAELIRLGVSYDGTGPSR